MTFPTTQNPAWTSLVDRLRKTSAPLADLLLELRSRGPRDRRYRVIDEIARGGMGIVYRVADRDLDRTVAMKVAREPLPISTARLVHEHSTLFQARFLRELRITGQLDHPGIVSLLDCGIDRHERLFFTMKLVEGENVATLLRAMKRGESDWNLARVVSALLRVCEAMAHAHERKIIHRDLKPANLMVGRYGEVYVMDWGLARVLGEDFSETTAPSTSADGGGGGRRTEEDEPRTMEGEALGTPSYMPPEQALGLIERVGATADIYAVGAILYHALTGSPPYTVTASGAPLGSHDLLRLVAIGSPAEIGAVAPTAPPELVAISERAMARQPEDRYPSMNVFAEDLRAWLEGRVVLAYEAGPWAEFRKWYHRNRRVALIAIVSAILLLVAIGVLLRSSENFQRLTHDYDESMERIVGLEDARDAALAEGERQAARADDSVRARDESTRLLADSNSRLALSDQAATAERQRAARLEAENQALRAVASRPEDPPVEEELPPVVIDRSAEVDELRARLDRLGDLTPELVDSLHAFDLLATRLIELRTEMATLSNPVATKQARYDEWLAEYEAALAECGTLEAALDRLPKGASSVERAFDPARLTALLRRLRDDLESVPLQDGALLPRDVRHLAARAAKIRETAATPPEIAITWDEAAKLVAKIPGFDGVRLLPQSDLVPLGLDPESGLLEFWHSPSGDAPTRDAKKMLRFDDSTGIVFVLLPGGEFRMGAQAKKTRDRGGANYDPEAEADEASESADPVTVRLDPYLVARHELTAAQYRALSGRTVPSYFAPDSEPWLFPGADAKKETIDLRHPVEGLDWRSARNLLTRYDLSLPTEAQWEFAARGIAKRTVGKHADLDGIPWWFGDDERARKDLGRYANFLDGKNGAAESEPAARDKTIGDPFVLHARVGSLEANPFGLYDVLGNVGEWCLDPRSDFLTATRDGDGMRENGARGLESQHAIRGGSFRSPSAACRTTARRFGREADAFDDVGLRPVRLLPR